MKELQKLFILGNPRSGTSLFRIILNNHRDIVAPPECGFAHWLMPKYSDWRAEDIVRGRLKLFLDDLLNTKKFETWQIDYERMERLITEQGPMNYSELTSLIYLAYGSTFESTIVDKNNYYIKHLEELQMVWPEAAFIHIIRDPRDVICSYKELNSSNFSSKYSPVLTDEISEIVSEWKDNNKRIESFLSNKNSIRVKYEDLVLNTERQLHQVVEFLSLDFDESMLMYYHERKNKKSEPQETIEWKMKTREAPDASRIGRYMYDLTSSEIHLIESELGDSLRHFNYE